MADLNKEDGHGNTIKNNELVNTYKAVALIHLGRYSEGLPLCEHNSYEAAYVYYKLKKYKKSMKICKTKNGEKWEVLKSQNLYALGYYNAAYYTLVKLAKDDEIMVNLQAMKSLSILTEKVNKVAGHSLYIKQKEESIMFEDLKTYNFNNLEIKAEFYFNKSFEFADCKSVFMNNLKKCSEEFIQIKNNLFLKQLFNLEEYFDEINFDSLTKTQKSILNYNMKNSNSLDNDVHYLQNYTDGLQDNEYKWILFCKNKNWTIQWNTIPNTTRNLRLLRLLVGLKNKTMSTENVLKYEGDLEDESIKPLFKEYVELHKSKVC